ncbi:helix-turn-helix domain-containing protein [Victivallis vadensis]|uniref:helix-turn-helix domain-containing protein n=1 Tax=Victivallis vadensis TaxID=172901 RepID=UPI00266CB5F7|nr:helix-turn-helix transcriptional regulator [Victivallis vadensis]
MKKERENAMIENRIGRKIHQYRKDKNLTIKEFSDISGISTALVSQLERGIKINLPDAGHLAVVAVL